MKVKAKKAKKLKTGDMVLFSYGNVPRPRAVTVAKRKNGRVTLSASAGPSVDGLGCELSPDWVVLVVK
jgi:hypothetical protein